MQLLTDKGKKLHTIVLVGKTDYTAPFPSPTLLLIFPSLVPYCLLQ